MKAIILTFALVFNLILSSITDAQSVSVGNAIFNTKYDYQFKKYWDLYNPPSSIYEPWKLLKAQCYAESAFKPDAVSYVGAQGICQFMPATWNQYGVGNPFDADANINASALYMSKLIYSWKSPRPDQDRMKLAQASYNAGFGNLLKAQKACGSPNKYNDIIACLHKVTGHHSKETITYVKRIWVGYYKLISRI